MSDHPPEERLRMAVQAGSRDPEMRRHLDGCEECREQAEVLRFMLAVAETKIDAALPDPQVVKLKAQLVNRGRLDEHAAHQISSIQRGVWIGVAAAWVLVIALNWERISAWVIDFDPAEIVISSVAGGGEGSFGLLLLLATLASITAMVAVHAIFAEE